MDPYSADGELTNLHTAFHTGQYTSVSTFDASSLSPSNALPARILSLRARLALNEDSAVITELSKEKPSDPSLLSILAYAQHTQNTSSDTLSTLESLAKEHGSAHPTCLILAATALCNSNDGREKDALALLEKHEGSIDVVALIVQLHLSQNRLDLAQAEVRKARTWAQDHLLVNLAEAWVGLREGGPKYQPAFYVYEELATAPPTLPDASADNTRTLLGQAVCELHLGRLPEAEAAVKQALEQEGENADVLANAVVLYTVMGRREEAAGYLQRLGKVSPGHEMCQGLEGRRSAFEAAKARYSPVFEVKA